jgi:hypothetical protein
VADATRRYTAWDSLYCERLRLHLSSPVLYRESEGDQRETDRHAVRTRTSHSREGSQERERAVPRTGMQELGETRWYDCLSQKSHELMGLSLRVWQLLYQTLTVLHEAFTRLLHTSFTLLLRRRCT